MKLTKVHTTGRDYLIAEGGCSSIDKALTPHLLNRRRGIGGDGIILIENIGADREKMRLFRPDGGEDCFDALAVAASAEYLHDCGQIKSKAEILHGGFTYQVRLTLMGNRVICVWVTLPALAPKPMEQLKYYYGVRGEVLRACLVNPKICLYDLCGMHAVFLLESCAALRGVNLKNVCRRLREVLFYNEAIDLHFAAVSGDNAISVRSFCGDGETAVSGAGAAVCAYAARASGLADSDRILLTTSGGTLCTEQKGAVVSLCAKCETVFSCEADI